MSENTKIEWAHHTGGPWLGCTEVSCGCGHCYSRELTVRRLAPIIRRAYRNAGFEDWETRPVWGDKAPRVLTKNFWREARMLNKKAEGAYTRPRMFPSLIDWLDDLPAGIIDQDGKWLNRVEVIADFLRLIAETSNLNWLLLTKRPQNWHHRIEQALDFVAQQSRDDQPEYQWMESWLIDGKGPNHVWIGTSVEDQQRADERIPVLLKIPAQVRFLSIEPLLGPLDITGDTVEHMECGYSAPAYRTSLKWKDGDPYCPECEGWPAVVNGGTILDGIQWVIVGGESGPKARLCNMGWIRGIVHECQDANVPVFVKQLGAIPAWDKGSSDEEFYLQRVRANMGWHDKGGDPAEWPADLRVRQFPEVPA